jgi:hypothetical protein
LAVSSRDIDIGRRMNRDFKYNPKIESNLWESVKDLIYRLLEPKSEKRITDKEVISQKLIN